MIMSSRIVGGRQCLPHFAPRPCPRRQPSTDSARSLPHCACSLRQRRRDQQAQQRSATGSRHVLVRATQPVQSDGRVSAPAASTSGNGLFALLVINIGLFALQAVLQQGWVPLLYLNHAHPRWYQFITSSFCHADFQHLSSNLFMLYVFGRSVEADEGGVAVWATYLVCALGANVASLLLLPRNCVSLGASGAVFGLFTLSVLIKLAAGFQPKKLVEAAILGQFVLAQLQQEVRAQSALIGGAAIQGTSISHVAHLAGALVGVLLVFALTRLPE